MKLKGAGMLNLDFIQWLIYDGSLMNFPVRRKSYGGPLKDLFYE
jgi:hypothetical protein